MNVSASNPSDTPSTAVLRISAFALAIALVMVGIPYCFRSYAAGVWVGVARGLILLWTAVHLTLFGVDFRRPWMNIVFGIGLFLLLIAVIVLHPRNLFPLG